MSVGMPRPPLHPPYLYSMSMAHDWTPSQPSPITGTADSFAMGTHVGTHIDSIFHIARENRLHGGAAIGDGSVSQSAAGGLNLEGRENFEPIVAPGVLLDFSALLGVDLCPADLEIGPDEIGRCLDLTGAVLREGDAVLFRTGWDRLWDEDPTRYVGYPMPGVTFAGARMLRAAGVCAVGSDTPAFEKVPAPNQLAAHAELLVDGGIPILECLALAELAELAPAHFLFVCAPMRMTGATGCPVNPLALIPHQ
jgi:kynurenine formamidase